MQSSWLLPPFLCSIGLNWGHCLAFWPSTQMLQQWRSRFHGSPKAVALSFLLLFGVPLLYYVLYRREKLILDQTFRLMLAFLLATTVSACFAQSLGIALEWILIFAVEGLVLYFLITNVVRSLQRFDVSWPFCSSHRFFRRPQPPARIQPCLLQSVRRICSEGSRVC